MKGQSECGVNKMISIITPSHNPKYLKELEASILAQNFYDWEWIIGLNHGAKYQSDNKRIKILTVPIETESVGALKKWCCEQSRGDIILEIDHDDLITTDCLIEVQKAFENPKVGFVYSDNMKLPQDKPFIPYPKEFGWSFRKEKFQEKELYCMNSQPLTPGRFGYIWFMPDHLRAWRKSFYDKIGGHNPKLDVLDDQDLMHRLYMVCEFKHIPKALYVYRITGDNTWLHKNQLIQSRTVEIYNNHIFDLAERFADLNKVMKIDLCGGINKYKDWKTIDVENADIIYDLNKGIPLADNSVGVIRAVDALEHIKDKEFIMQEIWRVLISGGILLSCTPSTDGRGAFQDPTHVSFWNENSFWYWTREEQMKYIKNTKYKFRECRLNTIPLNKWNEEHKIVHVVAHLEVLK